VLLPDISILNKPLVKDYLFTVKKFLDKNWQKGMGEILQLDLFQ
jgi:hypothetical protein